MIAVTDYTSYAEIRAVLGVDAIELPDSVLALSVFASALQRALRGFVDSDGNSLVTLFDAIDPDTATDDEEYLYYTIKEYATYIVAEACCSGLSMYALKSDSDGKATQTRFSSEATFKDVVKAIHQKLASLTGTLDTLIGTATMSAVEPIVTRIVPVLDRVTDQ